MRQCTKPCKAIGPPPKSDNLAFPYRGAGPDVPTDIATPQETAVQFYMRVKRVGSYRKHQMDVNIFRRISLRVKQALRVSSHPKDVANM